MKSPSNNLSKFYLRDKSSDDVAVVNETVLDWQILWQEVISH